jgi:hypothetical protein
MKNLVLILSVILIASCKSGISKDSKQFLGSETSYALIMLSVDVLCKQRELIPKTDLTIKCKIALYKDYLENKKNRTSQEELHLLKIKYIDSDADFNKHIEECLIKNRESRLP